MRVLAVLTVALDDETWRRPEADLKEFLKDALDLEGVTDLVVTTVEVQS